MALNIAQMATTYRRAYDEAVADADACEDGPGRVDALRGYTTAAVLATLLCALADKPDRALEWEAASEANRQHAEALAAELKADLIRASKEDA